ncbi:MAG TPA: acyl-CoA desaturase [Hanamia sp.]|nr:acyl-CoA desaturase [Hanamia sp.]
MSIKIKFAKANNTDFYTTVNARVEQYFTNNNLSKNANRLMVFKTVFYLSVFIGAFLLLILNSNPLWFQFMLWMVLGFFTAFIGLNISHDAIHGALSRRRKMNKLLSYSFNVIGANAYIWSIMHNIVHHTYTNIEGHDEDITSVPLLRMSPHQRLRKIHRYQYWYAFLFYGFGSLSWVFVKDYVKFFKKKIGNYENKKHPRVEYFKLFFFKLVYYMLFLVLPVILINALWWQILLGFLVLHFCEGITMAIIFMLAHEVEETQFPLPDERGNIMNSWAVHQLYTTADFGRGNKLLSFFCGGLNFQVEHHLFPRICHVHYKPISDIVKETAEEYSLRYNTNHSFGGAIRSHVRFLKNLGKEDKGAAV